MWGSFIELSSKKNTIYLLLFETITGETTIGSHKEKRSSVQWNKF